MKKNRKGDGNRILEGESRLVKVKVAQWCPILCDPHGLYSPRNSPGQNTGVGSLSLLQWIFSTQELNWGLLHCRWILYQLSYEGSPGLVVSPKVKVKVKSLSCVRLFVTPWTVTYQAPPSMGFSRQEYWSGLPFPLQGIFLTQGLNPCLLHGRWILHLLSQQVNLSICYS